MKYLSNNNLVFFFLLVICFVTSGSCTKSYANDIEISGKNYWLSPSKINSLIKNQSTEKDIYKLAGQEPTSRLSFKPELPVRHAGTYIPIDRVIYYAGYRSLKEKNKDGKYVITTTTTSEKMRNVYYLYNGVIVSYSIMHKKSREVDGKVQWYYDSDTTPDVIAVNQMSNVWPDAPCHQEYYTVNVLKKREAIYDDCYWQDKDFEIKLKKSGYYDKL